MSMLAEQSSTLGLSQLAAAIKDAIAAGDAAAQKSVEHYATAGKHLIKVKEMLPHGEWESWVMVNADKSLSTIRGYMRLAKLDKADQQRVADLSLRQALEEIAEPQRKNEEEIQIEHLSLTTYPRAIVSGQWANAAKKIPAKAACSVAFRVGCTAP